MVCAQIQTLRQSRTSGTGEAPGGDLGAVACGPGRPASGPPDKWSAEAESLAAVLWATRPGQQT